MKKKRILFTLLFTLFFVVPLVGCMNILAEDLYSLPRLPSEYQQLQSQIEELLEEGAELSSPIGGMSRQGIQMIDLTGSGQNEILVFLYSPADGLLSLHIFTYESGDYSLAEVIEVRGISFESVRFVDMDGDGILEIALGFTATPTLRQMEVFSIVDFEATSLARFNYIDFIDFDLTGDGYNDIIVISPMGEEHRAAISLYSIMSSGEPIISSAELMNDIGAYIRIVTGRLIDDTPAVFVESEAASEEGHEIETEIFIFDGNEITKTTLSRD